eukprot:scaffold17838_cov55-Phaeocystis_antarctica.AAC.4
MPEWRGGRRVRRGWGGWAGELDRRGEHDGMVGLGAWRSLQAAADSVAIVIVVKKVVTAMLTVKQALLFGLQLLDARVQQPRDLVDPLLEAEAARVVVARE